MPFRLEPKLPSADGYFHRLVEAVSRNQPFVYAKINHGFWERLALIRSWGFDLDTLGANQNIEIDKRLGVSGSAFAETGFLSDVLAMMPSLPAPDEGFDFCPSIVPWPFSDVVEGTPRHNRAECEALIKTYVAPAHLDNAKQLGMTGHDLKSAIIAGRFHDIIEPISRQPLILIANPNMREFGKWMGAGDVEIVEIDGASARVRRQAILDKVNGTLERRPDVQRIVLQAGESLSTWLSCHLFRTWPNLQIIDFGNAMTICNPSVALRQNWVRVYACAISYGLDRWRPGTLPIPGTQWVEGLRPQTFRDESLVDLAFAQGVAKPRNTWLLDVPVSDASQPVAFIENKAIDFDRVQAFLSLSSQSNHHANGGPVSRLLEESVARLLNLPEGRKVIACASATAGLFLAASLRAYQSAQLCLRWVTSACGFFSCNIGPLAETTILDCDERGRFDLEGLASLPEDSWDGVIFTNLFAQHSNWSEVRDFCRARGKSFVIDNAVGLLDRPADSHIHRDLEVISCHHTKPWGYGEGGLMIVDAEDEDDIRRLMNFGAGMPSRARAYACNAKISDLSCAAILDRIERMAYWGSFYHMQERRILSTIENYGVQLYPLTGETTALSPRAHLPLLADRPVDVGSMQNPVVVLRKYYRPLAPSGQPMSDRREPSHHFAKAEALFASIVCCPCNPQLRDVSADRLGETLRGVLV